MPVESLFPFGLLSCDDSENPRESPLAAPPAGNNTVVSAADWGSAPPPAPMNSTVSENSPAPRARSTAWSDSVFWLSFPAARRAGFGYAGRRQAASAAPSIHGLIGHCVRVLVRIFEPGPGLAHPKDDRPLRGRNHLQWGTSGLIGQCVRGRVAGRDPGHDRAADFTLLKMRAPSPHRPCMPARGNTSSGAFDQDKAFSGPWCSVPSRSELPEHAADDVVPATARIAIPTH